MKGFTFHSLTSMKYKLCQRRGHIIASVAQRVTTKAPHPALKNIRPMREYVNSQTTHPARERFSPTEGSLITDNHIVLEEKLYL